MILSKEIRLKELQLRLALLEARGPHNASIVAKIKREIKKYRRVV